MKWLGLCLSVLVGAGYIGYSIQQSALPESVKQQEYEQRQVEEAKEAQEAAERREKVAQEAAERREIKAEIQATPFSEIIKWERDKLIKAVIYYLYRLFIFIMIGVSLMIIYFHFFTGYSHIFKG